MTKVESPSGRDLVLSFDFPPEIGGAHKWLYEIYSRWPTQVDALTHRYPLQEQAAERARNFDLTAHGSLRIFRELGRYGDLSVVNPRFFKTIWQCRQRAQVIARSGSLRLHALRAFPEGFAGYVVQRTRPARTMLITYAHGEELLVAKTSRQLTYMAQSAYKHSSVVIANSENTRRAVLELVPTAHTEVIHPGVDCASFNRQADLAQRFRADLGWPDGTVIVLTLGRMEPRKNHAGVMQAISQLRQKGLQIGFICAGNGPESSALIELSASLGIRSWVRFPGEVGEHDKQILFGAADIFAMPSIRVGSMIEGFGLVFLEAAAAGVPAICGNSGGQPEAVQNGVTGTVIDGTDVAAIAFALEELAFDTERRKAMGEAARKWAAQHDWRNIANQVARVAFIDSMAS